MSPGSSVVPGSAISRPPDGTDTAGPAAAIRPSRTRTDHPSCMASPSKTRSGRRTSASCAAAETAEEDEGSEGEERAVHGGAGVGGSGPAPTSGGGGRSRQARGGVRFPARGDAPYLASARSVVPSTAQRIRGHHDRSREHAPGGPPRAPRAPARAGTSTIPGRGPGRRSPTGSGASCARRPRTCTGTSSSGRTSPTRRRWRRAPSPSWRSPDSWRSCAGSCSRR